MAHVITDIGVDLGQITDKAALTYYKREPGYTIDGVVVPPLGTHYGTGPSTPAWQALTVYTAGQLAADPSTGVLIRRITAGTSRATFDATEQALWTEADILTPAQLAANSAFTATYPALRVPTGLQPAGTDSGAAVNTASDAVHAAGGGIVYLPPQTGGYTFTSPLTRYTDVLIWDASRTIGALQNGNIKPGAVFDAAATASNPNVFGVARQVTASGGAPSAGSGVAVGGYDAALRTGGSLPVWARNTVVQYQTAGDAFGDEIDYQNQSGADAQAGQTANTAFLARNEGGNAGCAGYVADHNTSLTNHRFRHGFFSSDAGDLDAFYATADASPVDTTSGTAVAAPGAVVITPASMTNIVVGKELVVDIEGGNYEPVIVTAVTGTTFTATFTQTHGSGFTINSCPAFGINLANVPKRGLALAANGKRSIVFRTQDFGNADAAYITVDSSGSLAFTGNLFTINAGGTNARLNPASSAGSAGGLQLDANVGIDFTTSAGYGGTCAQIIVNGTDQGLGNFFTRGVRSRHVAGATPTGGYSGEIAVGTGKVWVNDAGTWKSAAVA